LSAANYSSKTPKIPNGTTSKNSESRVTVEKCSSIKGTKHNIYFHKAMRKSSLLEALIDNDN